MSKPDRGSVRSFAEVQAKFLQTKLSESQTEQERLQAVTAANLRVLRRVHEACIEWLYMGSYDQALEWLHRRGPQCLGIDEMLLAIESDEVETGYSTRYPSAIYLSKGSVNNYVSQSQGKVLTNVIPVPAVLFGIQAARLRSWAAVRLDFIKTGMLLLASEDPESYRENQSTDLLEFFAKVVEYKLRHWQP